MVRKRGCRAERWQHVVRGTTSVVVAAPRSGVSYPLQYADLRFSSPMVSQSSAAPFWSRNNSAGDNVSVSTRESGNSSGSASPAPATAPGGAFVFAPPTFAGDGAWAGLAGELGRGDGSPDTVNYIPYQDVGQESVAGYPQVAEFRTHAVIAPGPVCSVDL